MLAISSEIGHPAPFRTISTTLQNMWLGELNSLIPTIGNHPPINYLSRAQSTRLKLVQGDSESFSDVLTLINEYEGKSPNMIHDIPAILGC